jgi:hypothetical protein
MKTRCVSAGFCACFALAVALSGVARADADDVVTGPRVSPATGQARIAGTTLRLEQAFSEQFVKGQIDRDALAPLVSDVVQAMPEETRPKVQSHVEEVLAAGQALAGRMTPEERARVAAPPAASEMGKARIGVITAWGWPSQAGWGGLGAFGFPGMYGNCIPYSNGYAYPIYGGGWNNIVTGFTSASYSSYSCGWYW